jgi:FemAB-related protein (PEP-CTERM system-associated)
MHARIHVQGPAIVAPEVRVLADVDQDRWDAFVYAHPDATFFHRAGWKEVIKRAFGHPIHYYYAEQGGEITGVLPLVEIQSKLFGHTLTSLPFCAYGGVLATNSEATNALDQAARKLAQSLNVDVLEYRNLRPFHSDWPTKDLYATFRKTILPEVEQNMNAIPRKQRAMVRKGIKAGLISEEDDDVDRFYHVFSDNVHRHGTPAHSKNYFRILREVFGKDCSVLSIVKKGRVVSSVMSFHFRYEILPYYAGDMPEARGLAANDFKYWELMRHSCEAGYRLFDFGRSKIGTGPYHFKKNWGFEPQPLFYENFLVKAKSVPEVNPLNPKYRLFISAWKKLPLPVANAIGPSLVKFLG